MRHIDTVQGYIWTHDQDQVGAVCAGMQFWDWQVIPAIDRALAIYGPHRAAIDLGAAFGWFTVYLAPRFRWVYAAEMHPQTFQLLQHNIEERDLRNVLIYNVAAYDRETRLDLATGEELGWPVPENLNDTPNPCSIAVMPGRGGSIIAKPFDLLVPRRPPVGFVKCDVQGCDLLALRGLDRTLIADRPVVAFEWESGPAAWHGTHWPDVLTFFQDLNYILLPLQSPIDFMALPMEQTTETERGNAL